MNIIRIALEIFFIYLLYKFIFDFIIPVYESSKRIRKQFGDMQEKMQQDMNRYQNMNETRQQSATTSTQKEPKKEGDYIDFEEIK